MISVLSLRVIYFVPQKNFKLYVWNFNAVAVKYEFFKKKICNISNLGYSVLLSFRNKTFKINVKLEKIQNKKICNVSNLGYSVLLPFRNKQNFQN